MIRPYKIMLSLLTLHSQKTWCSLWQ